MVPWKTEGNDCKSFLYNNVRFPALESIYRDWPAQITQQIIIKLQNEKKILFAIIDVLIVSILPDVLIKISEGFVPGWLPFAKIFISLGMVLICISVKEFKQLLNFAIVLFTISLLQTLIPLVS